MWMTRSLLKLKFGDVPQMQLDDFQKRQEDKQAPSPIVLDVREVDEFAVSHIPNAVRVPPSDTDAALRALRELEYAPGRPVVCYCSVGYRSCVLARALRTAQPQSSAPRPEDVYNLDGSIFAWANEGRPVFQGERRVKGVHPYNDTFGALLNPDLRVASPEEARAKPTN